MMALHETYVPQHAQPFQTLFTDSLQDKPAAAAAAQRVLWPRRRQLEGNALP